jgi:hypothetical protein
LLIGCVSYLIQSFAALLFPNFNVSIVLFTDWGELFFPLWLVTKGVVLATFAIRLENGIRSEGLCSLVVG